MKVVYIISSLKRTGPVNVLHNIIKYLDKSKIEPIIITLSPEPEEGSRIADFKEMGIKIHSLELSRLKGYFFAPAKIKKIIKTINPDLIHSQCLRSNLFSAIFLNKYKNISCVHNYAYEDYTMSFGKIKGAIFAYLNIKAMEKFIVNIPGSNSVKNKLLKKSKMNLKVISNGIDPSIFSLSSAEQKIKNRKELNLPTDKKIFIFIDALISRKDPLTSINSFIDAFSNEEAFLLILGGGPLFDECKKITAKQKNILMVGQINSTALYKNYLTASDYYITSSLAEGFHLTIVESMACGMPVVVSNIGPHSEILSINPKAGLLFNIKDTKDMSAKLKEIILLDYAEHSSAAIDIAQNHLNAVIESNSYQELYLSLENNKKR